jgi:type VI secretion system protein ImpL
MTIVWIAGMLVTAVTVLLVALRFGIDRDGDKAGMRRTALDISKLRSSFRDAVARIERNIAEHGKRYDIPWVVLLHDGSTASRPAVEDCGLTRVLDGDIGEPERDAPRWHFFDRGIVIELESEQLDDPASIDLHEKRWEEFVALCGQYRPQRPLDSVIVSVPAALLADRTPEGRERLRLKADAASRRIWIAQNRYAMRFAVYVVVSGCEALPGFAEFAHALPEAMRDSMLGWSSPYQPSALYQPGWVTQAFDQVEQNLADTGAELFASNAPVASPPDLFLLPSRLASLRTGMAGYLDELMRPNAYHEPFFLRGIYFSGSAARPLFLRDMLDTKVFGEFGLSRAAHSQKLARPLMSRIGRWFAVGLPLVYAFGILITTIQLQRVLPVLGEGLEGLRRDSEFRAQAISAGERIEFEWYRKTALQLMIGLEELQSRRLTNMVSMYDANVINPFMPGSWPLFDDLRERARNRIRDSFAELGVHTLQQAIYRRTAELTNAPLNPVSFRLTGSSTDCEGPSAGSIAVPSASHRTVAVENLTEFATLQRYATELARLDASASAMQNLKTPHKGSSKELHGLVLDMLGADLPGDLQASQNLFRAATVSDVMLVDRPSIAAAARCGFVKATLAMNRKLFDENALVEGEERVAAARNTVLNLFGGNASPNSAEVIAAYRKLLEALTEQKALLSHGHGGWLMQDELKLGASHDKLMQQFADNKLIGPEIVAEVQRKSREDFTRTRQHFLSLFGAGSEMAINQSGKDGGLALSKDRLALLAAIEHLLSQPFMLPAVGDALEATQRGTLLQWDNEQLSRAVKLGDGRRKYLSDDLPKFPADMQEAVRDVIDYQYALRLVDLAGHAYTPADPDQVNAAGASWTAFEQASSHVKKLVALLKELGQDGESRTLQAILANDAAVRIRMVNVALQDAHVYQVLDDADDLRSDPRATLNLFANSGGDVSDYLAQQLAKMQSLSAQAQMLRASLPPESKSGAEITRWNSIARELELYAAKDPKGSIGRLERFLTDLARELDAPACLAVLKANEPAKRVANYFADKHSEIHRAVMRRCMVLDRRSFSEQWTVFAADFNRLLKGRRPFIGNRSGLRGSEFAGLSAADLSETGSLLNRLPPVSAEIFARNNVPEGSIAPIRDFAAQAAQVRQLLSPLFPADTAQPAALDVSVRFRANVNGELDGNKIIDWALTIGDQTLKLRDTPRALRWKAGDPVRLTLRFANDVPLVPRADPDNPYLEVSRKSVVFRFDGPWALLDMVQLLRSADGSDARASLLKLEIPVLADAKDTALRAKPVRTFVAITLSEPGKTAPLPWPTVFPERAPMVEK